MVFFLVSVFVFGMLFGSFASVVIYRLHSGKKGIMNGRSECPKCHTLLGVSDLFPVFSYLFSYGKCQHCGVKIPVVYPLLELSMGLLFLLSSYFLIDIPLLLTGDFLTLGKLFFFLVIAFCTVVYVFYDFMYLEIPESILLVANISAFTWLVIEYMAGGEHMQSVEILLLVASIIIFGLLYFIMLREQSEKRDICILVCIALCIGILYQMFGGEIFSFPVFGGMVAGYILFIFFYIQYFLSGGSWIGGGDFRIALLMGLLLGLPLLMIGFFGTYITGSILGLGYLSYLYITTGKIKQKTVIPFGPFLAFGIYFALFYGQQALQTFFYYL